MPSTSSVPCLMCDSGGCPVAVEVFPGNTADPATLGSQVAAVRRRFSPSKVVLVGDRGMLTQARIREEVEPAGLDWISALRGPAIRALMQAGEVEMSLFDERDLLEITSDAYPGERLIVCRNPLLAEDRAARRQDLLAATEALLEPIAEATRREKRRFEDPEKIGERVGKVIGRDKMAKHVTWAIDDDVSSPGGAMIPRSPPRRSSTVSVSSAPACRSARPDSPAIKSTPRPPNQKTRLPERKNLNRRVTIGGGWWVNFGRALTRVKIRSSTGEQGVARRDRACPPSKPRLLPRHKPRVRGRRSRAVCQDGSRCGDQWRA